MYNALDKFCVVSYINNTTLCVCMGRGRFVDLVIGGPDMSGTGTQVEDIIKYFQDKGKVVRDIRGTEIDVLFHSAEFQKTIKAFGNDFLNFKEFSHAEDSLLSRDFLSYANYSLSEGGTNQDLQVASMVRNDFSSYVDPDSANVWVMEEPAKRGAGQVCRALEQNRSAYGDSMNGKAAAEAHSIYRTDEFLRFRQPLREADKIIIRSRSEESACYQIEDEKVLLSGVSKNYYFNLEGHKVAFANPPSHVFVVCASKDWTEREYLELKRERSKGRTQDDYEKNSAYQVMVNNRYAGEWLENFYAEGCGRFGVRAPEIKRFNIYDSKEEIKRQMIFELEGILRE